MARLLYGCTAADYTTTGSGQIIPSATVTVWDSEVAGAQITDLLVGGVGSAMLSYETIEVTVTLGTSPTGRWSVVAVPTGWAGRVRVVSVTETTATIHIYDTAWTPGALYATPQPLFFWQAVAY